MVRLTAPLILSSETRYTPTTSRELVLRSNKINLIENLSTTSDQYSSIDLSDNEITLLGNMPVLKQLQELHLGNNFVTSIESSIGLKLPNLQTLSLSGSSLQSFASLLPLFALPLKILNLQGNPVSLKENYRMFTVSGFLNPKTNRLTLKMLDLDRVTDKERQRSIKFKASSAGVSVYSAAMRLAGITDSLTDGADGGGKTFELGTLPLHLRTSQSSAGVGEVFKVKFTASQKSAIRRMIESATNPMEIDRIERCVEAGVFPAAVVNMGVEEVAKVKEVEMKDEEEEEEEEEDKNSKRSIPDDEESSAKRTKVVEKAVEEDDEKEEEEVVETKKVSKARKSPSPVKKAKAVEPSKSKKATETDDKEEEDEEDEAEEVATPKVNYKSQTVVQLRKLLSDRSLDTKGIKNTLIKRLEDSDAQN